MTDRDYTELITKLCTNASELNKFLIKSTYCEKSELLQYVLQIKDFDIRIIKLLYEFGVSHSDIRMKKYHPEVDRYVCKKIKNKCPVTITATSNNHTALIYILQNYYYINENRYNVMKTNYDRYINEQTHEIFTDYFNSWTPSSNYIFTKYFQDIVKLMLLINERLDNICQPALPNDVVYIIMSFCYRTDFIDSDLYMANSSNFSSLYSPYNYKKGGYIYF